MSPRKDVVLAGAGPWGLAAGWYLVGDGAAVTVLDDEALPVVPELGELRFAEASAGLRPATHNGLPVIDAAPEGVIRAGGGHRNRILLHPSRGPGGGGCRPRCAHRPGCARDLGSRAPREGSVRC
jgi:glycine/D-amino acid oxidase-like deaminating enzyme